MILLHLSFFIALSFANGGEQQTPKAGRQDYATAIKESQERRAKAEREWRRLLEAYDAPLSQSDLYPITCMPRSLAGAAAKIQITSSPIEPGSEKTALRVAVKQFIDRWRELIGADTESVSLVTEADSGDVIRLTYRQANYPFPVAGGFGQMTVAVSRQGRLMQLDDRFIPQVELTARPEIERDAAAKKLLGRAFAYRDSAGREQRAEIGSLDEISVKRLVVLPVEKSDQIEIRLAWEIIAGKSLSWTVHIDAVTGAELRATQNFET
jgi:hypothetical protein